MTRILLCALLLAALAALPADGYQFLSQPVPSVAGVLPDRWQALPIDMVVDNDNATTPLLPEVQNAISTWNGVTTAQSDLLGTCQTTDSTSSATLRVGRNSTMSSVGSSA